MAAPALARRRSVRAIWPAIKCGVGSAAADASGDGPRGGLHDLGDIWPRELQRRRETEDDSCKERDGYAEEEHGQVDLNRCLVREKSIRAASLQ